MPTDKEAVDGFGRPLAETTPIKESVRQAPAKEKKAPAKKAAAKTAEKRAPKPKPKPEGPLVKCVICGFEGKYIGVHVQREHGLKPSEYTKKHNAPTFAPDVNFGHRGQTPAHQGDPKLRPTKAAKAGNQQEQKVVQIMTGRPGRGVPSVANELDLDEAKTQKLLDGMVAKGTVKKAANGMYSLTDRPAPAKKPSTKQQKKR